MDILIKDGVKYFQADFHGKENEFEKIVFSQYKYLFGDNSILFTKRKIQTETSIGTIPDAFIIDFEKEKWFIIEVEISNHDVYSHIVPQLTKFSSALNNPRTRKDLVKSFDNEIKSDPFKKALLLANDKTEIFKVISEIVDNNPELIIIIEREHDELKSIFNSLPFKTKISIFKTFSRDGVEHGDKIFLLEPFFSQKTKTVAKSVEQTVTIQSSKIDNKEDIPDYAKKYSTGLNDKNTLISKMLNYIKINNVVTWGELRKACVTEFGCKNEQSGSIGGSLNTLQHLKKIQIDGHGDNKKISILG